MHAGVAELADALDLGSSGAIREGSSPFARTTDRSASAHSKGAMMARNFGGTLEVTTSTREDGKTQVTVHMTADEVKKHIDKAFKDLSKTRIPGFRAGKAPRKVIEQNFPVFCSGTWAQDSSVRTYVFKWRCPIEIGQVTIHNGDIVFGDIDGVLIIPKDIAPEVIEKALVKASTEKTMRKAIEDGMMVTDAFAKFGVL